MEKSGKFENGYIGLRADGWFQQIISFHFNGPNLASIPALPTSRIIETSMGRRSLITAGTGAPTVVFEAGLGKGKEDWKEVFNGVAAQTRAIAYDRAGYGKSESSIEPREGHQIVRELRALLSAENLPPPYVLVGHSLGGTIVKLFARTHPEEVAGVVLVDARHADLARQCRQVGVLRLFYEPPQLLFLMSRAAARKELKAAPVTMRQARRAGPFPTIPLIVVTHLKASTHWPRALGKVWVAGQHHMMKMSALGRIKVCADSGHNVHRDQPDVVVQAILNVVNAVRYLHKKRTD